MHVFIKDFGAHVDEEVVVRGWVYNMRSSGKIAFLQLRDGSGFTQAIVSQHDAPEPVWEAVGTLTIETSVEISGVVSKHPKKEEYELQVRDVKVLHLAEEYPIGKKEHGPDFLLNNRHLWLRAPRQWAIQRIRHTIFYAIHEHLASEGFTRFDTPILTPTSCEDTTELFEMDYFPKENSGTSELSEDGTEMSVHDKAYLTQSGQLYSEAAIFSLGRVFDFGPVFRAEKSKTRRHLTEFWMMDAEIAFADWKENMDVQERMVQAIIKTVLERNQQELQILERDTSKLEACLVPFARMTHAEAVAKLQSMGSDIQPDQDMGADDETMLMQEFTTPLFIEKYPAKVKAFYMKPDPEDSSRVLCSDLLAPEGYGEVIGGSERIADYDLLVAKMAEFNLDRKPFEWYLDLRRYGSVPHAGFGIGLERTVAWICGLKHVRETIPFPRMINRLTP
ncbi:MAG: asparagine--tRNA ligase [Candidatus Kerfeldbacteria bacterium CG15_BIG_FIL_POST_REV_8_21_14_020_45_12]|uniref:Asparagine--tRNA ligase n=1 Tax=Candidatus Kerfeldbacteria bacterium CG15_BIG_FIL_POST_REV_8_21_14_020_45_12 TaxID=2014247 RepID=A0A2M7H3T6_9BACT|nr:MAG: asparagine--tRNA ligase [Candidatus Kerfeldbacteria bacterium CG15_BIG_FIL_POST_REV_8_21_14_020_45_12]PJA94016.1 MAG: asparagine--tRNA ligase [Candidatus Kerfeldbacteria bacterium CG_4_9_14_3_um_filter_45_8]